ncbi:MAG: TonB-dependent receptor, partial [Chitinophagaceae bacterium]|nr:TonB-dependent receptor [Chitinophagaceae bacterium]
SIKGIVTDAVTGETMAGASVTIKELNKSVLVELDGKFTIKNINVGEYHLFVSTVNYKPFEQLVKIEANKTTTVQIRLEPSVKEIQSVVVSSVGAGGEKNIRLLEKNASQVLNVVSAKNIQLLPDITVANVLQRVSGVTIERSGSGEARYPIIRGMDKRYINTLINGIKIPSPDNRSRFIPLDLFPSELLERLEVIKSLTPSMEADAIGGTINLVMKDAPMRKLFQVNFSTGYNNIFSTETYQKFGTSSINKQSPAEINGLAYVATPADFPVAQLNYTDKATPLNTTFGITYGNRIGSDKKLGFIISGSYQNIYRGTTSNFFLPNSQPGLNNIPLFSNLQLRKYSVQSRRVGINTKLDYTINSNNKISLSSSFVRLDDYQTRVIWDTVALNSLINNSYRSQWQYISIVSNNVQGLHKLSSTAKLDWNFVYSVANNHIPDLAEYTYQYPIVASSLAPVKLQSMTRNWQHNTDNDLAGYFNLTKDLQLFKKDFELKVGGLIRHKTRDNLYHPYSLSPVLNQVFTNINSATVVFNPVSTGTPTLNGNNYSFTENITAGYVQGKWIPSSKIEVLGGIRFENTNQSYTTTLTKDVAAKSGTIWYTDILPSGQIKYALTQSQTLRFSYYKALARPQFSELIPDGVNAEFFKEVGDPVNLKHSVADNLDLRYEHYTPDAGQILLGVFYKRIIDPIEISAVKPLNVNNLYLQPVNIGTATNYGFEAVLTKYFGMFGITANYTYTKSAITNDSLIYSSRNSNGIIVSSRVSETRPLQGQSNHIGNLSFIYKNPKIGLDVQIATVYTGERISFISPYLGLNYWQAPTTQLDFSFEKKLANRFTVYSKITNITNAPFMLFLKQPYTTYVSTSGSRALALQTEPDSKIIIQKDFYGTNFLFGFRYKLK